MDFNIKSNEVLPRLPEDSNDVKRFNEDNSLKTEALYRNIKSDLDKLAMLLKPTYLNLKARTNVTNPTYQVNIAWDKLRIEDIYRDSVFSDTLDITVAGDWDTGTENEQANKWYYIWAMAKLDGTPVCKFSASSTAPTMPVGYVYKRLISMVRNDAASNFLVFIQQDKNWNYSTYVLVINTFGSYALTERDLSNEVPETVNNIHMMFATGGSSAGGWIAQIYFNIHVYQNDQYIDWTYKAEASYFYSATYTYGQSPMWVKTYNRKIKTLGNYTTVYGAGTPHWTAHVKGFEVEL